MLDDYEVPVAKSVMQSLDRIGFSSSDEDIFIKYIMLWIAFNNIYVTLANQRGIKRKPETNKNDKSMKTITNGSIILPKMSRVTERAQIKAAYELFNDDIKDKLIKHESTNFFVNRVPRWEGRKIEFDTKGQRVNGVINLSYTYSKDYLYWSPIDINIYRSYRKGDESIESREVLSEQILNLLYAVRNNTFHGGKRFDDANDRNVVEKATPLLEIVVNYFYPYERYIH